MCRHCSQPARESDPSSRFSRRGLLQGGLLLAGAALAGCGGPQKPAPTPPDPRASGAQGRAISPTDPCAMRLHEMGAPLLLYYGMTTELPRKLEDLSKVPGFENIRDFTCPVSRQPYIYNPIGIVSPDDPARLIIYCPTPAHTGLRLGIAIIEPRTPQDALLTKVIALPESHFSLNVRVPK